MKNFMDKDRRVSIETIRAQFDVSEGTVQLFARNWSSGRFPWSVFPRVLREDQKQKRCHDSRNMVELNHSDPAVLDTQVTGNESWIFCYDPGTKRQSFQEGQTEQIHPQTFDDPFFDNTGMIYMHWVPTGQLVNKKYDVEVLREFRERFLRKRPALFKSGHWHFHQTNAPVNNSILVTDYLSKMVIEAVPHPAYSPDLAPCDFWISPKLRGCRIVTVEMMK